MKTRTKKDWLCQQWNSGTKLKHAVRRLALKDISKQEVVDFFLTTSRTIGYSASLPTPKAQSRKPTRNEVISEFTAVVGGLFGPMSTYADWKGTSVNAELKKHGYEEIAA